MAPIKLVIDTDGVADDVRAISLALQHPDVEVVAITTVAGCVSVDQSIANVARTLRANGVLGVPVYKGAEEALILDPHEPSIKNEELFFGSDGLGAAPEEWPPALASDFDAFVPRVHAAEALAQLFEQHRDLTLCCLGPLTNVALALKLAPGFAAWPRKVVVMGGNVHGKGNVRFDSTAECNFSKDPEAAHIVIKQLECPLTIVPWETFLHMSTETSVDFHAHLRLDARLARFFEMATRRGRKALGRCQKQYSYCDEVAVAIAIAPDEMVLQDKLLRGAVELHGEYTRGQMALDWTEGFWADSQDPKDLIQFVLHYNVAALDEMIFDTIRRSQERPQITN